MSRIIGDALVAGGSLSPDADSQQAALDELLKAVRLYGWPGCRGHTGCIYRAIEALSPEAARCLDDEGEREAYRRFHSMGREDGRDDDD